MLLGIHGAKRTGKDQAFQFIKEKYPQAERKAFGDLIKVSVANSFDLTLYELELLKNSSKARVVVLNGDTEVSSLSMRRYIELFGTKGHREVSELGNDFWVNYILPKDFDHKDNLVIITDVRFENEINRIKELNGKILKIKRNVVGEEKSDFEEDLDQFDYYINNNRDLESYKHMIHFMMDKFMETK